MLLINDAYQSKVLNEAEAKNSDETLTEALTKHTGPFIVYWLTQKNKRDDGIDKQNC